MDIGFQGNKRERTEIACICGERKTLKIGTVDNFIFESRIQVHNIPHFRCDFCGNVTYESNTGLPSLLKVAYRLKLMEIDWQQRDSTVVIFKIDLDYELKSQIEQMINKIIDDLKDGEPFLIMRDEPILGRRLENIVVLEEIITKVILLQGNGE
ncbi:hypothetical protein [Brevibacillus choshinensis]|uniref:Transposase n=1 Tax=Brevibacillus choshinensis TaxID=54911 RepID=A0ABX7FK20_BRECH|nr:hypothetical protein [Brevibacillus choshinensis]QRG65984.1 hypothetical protein JNE38_20720 [Brevibacillus choshinensis]